MRPASSPISPSAGEAAGEEREMSLGEGEDSQGIKLRESEEGGNERLTGSMILTAPLYALLHANRAAQQYSIVSNCKANSCVITVSAAGVSRTFDSNAQLFISIKSKDTSKAKPAY
jgi:hypothetical protein